ncbi:MAG: hypothetical protein J4F42_12705 [Desulfurellaceae bacterium]|nr:hypothetical protein [Desulfurellaceae bacterium]
MRELGIDRLESVLGTLLVVVDGQRLCALDYADTEERMALLLRRRYGDYRLSEVSDPSGFSSRLRAYFDGDIGCLDTVPLSLGRCGPHCGRSRRAASCPTGDWQHDSASPGPTGRLA